MGTYPVTCSGAVGPNYIISYVAGTLTINKAVLTATANNRTMTYGGTVPTFTYGVTGFVNGDTSSILTGAPVMTTTPLPPVAGSQAITITQGTLAATGGNYTFTFVNGTLTVSKAVLTVTANNQTMPEFGTVPPLTASYSGFVNGDTQAVLSGSPSLTTTATSSSTVGTYPITAAQGTLSAANYTFAFVGGTMTVTPVKAAITAPTKGSTIYGTSAVFTWSHETAATSYQLWFGSTPGTHNIAVITTSALTGTVTTLPANGSTIYVTLYGFAAGAWTVQDTATYTSQPFVKALITAPPKGSTFTGTSATFTWSAETNATSYQLWVGSTAGTHDIATITTSSLTVTTNGLPSDGRTLYVTLYGYSGGSWTVQDTATYTAVNRAKAVITSPPKGSTLPGSQVTFTWSAEAGATSYQLWVGTTPGANNVAVRTTSGLSTTVSGLPTNGITLYVTLYGYANGAWTVQDTATYTAF